jgi:class 3 adenylate cyclase
MPDIRYAKSGGVSIAYQVVGDADADLVYVPDYVSNLVYAWDSPYWPGFYERLASSFRLILFDKRGTGLSDGGAQFATLETRMEDLGAVLDAVGSERAVVFAGHEGCGMASLYAATYPERVNALVLFQPGWGAPDEEADRAGLRRLREEWGTREYCDEMLRENAPSLAESEDARVWFANWLRVGASPAVAYELNTAFFETDLADVLPAIRVPTLVIYRGAHMEEDSLDVARRIPSAHAVRLAGEDYWGPFLSPEIVDEIERFVAGEPVAVVPDSVLATVMFTDIVGSTERAAALRDEAWRDLLADHNVLVRRELARFRGEERDTAGDGFFATFDGPARAIRCAEAIIESLRHLGLEVRIGIHAGECERLEAKLGGIAVSIGARIGALAGPGEVLVSGTVRDLVAGSGLEFEDRGSHELKGVPGEWRLYAVRDS